LAFYRLLLFKNASNFEKIRLYSSIGNYKIEKNCSALQNGE